MTPVVKFCRIDRNAWNRLESFQAWCPHVCMSARSSLWPVLMVSVTASPCSCDPHSPHFSSSVGMSSKPLQIHLRHLTAGGRDLAVRKLPINRSRNLFFGLYR